MADLLMVPSTASLASRNAWMRRSRGLNRVARHPCEVSKGWCPLTNDRDARRIERCGPPTSWRSVSNGRRPFPEQRRERERGLWWLTSARWTSLERECRLARGWRSACVGRWGVTADQSSGAIERRSIGIGEWRLTVQRCAMTDRTRSVERRWCSGAADRRPVTGRRRGFVFLEWPVTGTEWPLAFGRWALAGSGSGRPANSRHVPLYMYRPRRLRFATPEGFAGI